MHEIPMKGADEYDAFTAWRKVLFCRPGKRKRAKAQYNRRARREAKQRLTKED